MKSPEDKSRELARREQELRERENWLRLQEIEAELQQGEPPLYQTVPLQEASSEKPVKQWKQKLILAAKFFGLVIVAVAAVKVAAWMANLVIVGLVAFAGYKLFLEPQRKKK